MTLASIEAIQDRIALFENILDPNELSSGSAQQPSMGAADLTFFHDDFSDGRMHGWRPVHFSSGVPSSPTSIETDYPFPGLFLATGDTPYRTNALANSVSTYKGLVARFPVTGIISFAGVFAVASQGPFSAWTSWGVSLDVQNWTDNVRASPTWIVTNPTFPGRPQLQLIDNSGTFHNVTGLTNPVTQSTISSTQYLFAGENEEKWAWNYLRVSYEIGNLFTGYSTLNGSWTAGSGNIALNSVTGIPTAGSGTITGITGTVSWTGITGDSLTGVTGGTGTAANGATLTVALSASYYEANINGFRFDLRSQAFGNGSYISPQTSFVTNQLGLIHSFGGGINFGLNLARTSKAAAASKLVAGDLKGFFHKTGWLA